MLGFLALLLSTLALFLNELQKHQYIQLSCSKQICINRINLFRDGTHANFYKKVSLHIEKYNVDLCSAPNMYLMAFFLKSFEGFSLF